MAYVISVCGSGGKTTLVKTLAKKYANENKKVCITTTTHMWYDEDVKESLIVGTDVKSGRVYYIANVNKEKELITPLNESDYKTICEKFDYVIIEADGSRSMPMKIPKIGEPAIPSNADEIIIVVGKEAIGREIGAVCHRFKEFYGNDKYLNDKKIKPETIVTEELLDDFVKHYYYEPLKHLHSDAKVSIYKNDFTRGSLSSPVQIAIVLCASGFSKRFGSNKLLIDANDIGVDNITSNCRGELCEPKRGSKKLYQLMIDKLLSAKEMLINKFDNLYEIDNESKKNLQLNDVLDKNNLKSQKNFDIDIVVVSQYDEILNDKNLHLNYK